jgi:glycogen debranching enzyme
MRRRTLIAGLALSPALSGVKGQANVPRPSLTPIIDSLAMAVSREENRQFSYTDKASGYFHGRTHTDNNPDWFNGWNIATKRIFHDYRLSMDGVALSRQDAIVVVAPNKIIRSFPKAAETLSMLDGLTVLVLTIGTTGNRIGLALTGDLTDAGTLGPEGVWFSPKEAAGTVLLVAPIAPRVTCTLDRAQGVTCAATGGGFYFIHAQNQSDARRLLARVRRGRVALEAARANRMEALVSGKHALDAGNSDRTKALLWMRLTGDQLIMKQLGTGIYAGLPWFNDYWGRDTFISITGLLFTMGRYDEAAEIFTSFAALQDVDPNSKTYGRVPNRARPDGIEYNSADGTPRFILALFDMVGRNGDVAFAQRLWPAVKIAVAGVLKNNVDELGLITHDDADTWMDAKEKGQRAWSPRGNRAVDVQALWLGAFGAIRALATWAKKIRLQPISDPSNPKFGEIEEVGPEAEFVANCNATAEKLRRAISTQFVDYERMRLVDHLKPDGTKDFKLRPNLVFALFGIDANFGPFKDKPRAFRRQQMMWTKQIWEGLAYPWGVATLSQDDPDFHPYHEHWHYYHKDAAYHNGTVWPWLNGALMSMLLGYGHTAQPWRLFENMNRQALQEGAVGSLAECADALPVDGALWARRTGTFLQAWSNAEHLRVWQEGFLGVEIRGLINQIVVNSSLPESAVNISMSVPYGKGHLSGKWHDHGPNRWSFELHGETCEFWFKVEDFKTRGIKWSFKPGQRVEITRDGQELILTAYNAAGRKISEVKEKSDQAYLDAISGGPYGHLQRNFELDEKQLKEEIFANLDFCQPRLQPNLKSLSVRHDPPLTY